MVTTGEGLRGHPSLAEVSRGDAVPRVLPAEPRPACPAACSDEEAVEEPKSRRVRASPSGKGVKVPLFPGLNTSALKVGPTRTLTKWGDASRAGGMEGLTRGGETEAGWDWGFG